MGAGQEAVRDGLPGCRADAAADSILSDEWNDAHAISDGVYLYRERGCYPDGGWSCVELVLHMWVKGSLDGELCPDAAHEGMPTNSEFRFRSQRPTFCCTGWTSSHRRAGTLAAAWPNGGNGCRQGGPAAVGRGLEDAVSGEKV
jgi:hypothetical protein